jgi:LPS-assembly protein
VIPFENALKMPNFALAGCSLLVLLAAVVPAFAQQPPATSLQLPAQSEIQSQTSDSIEQQSGDKHVKRIGHVEITLSNGTAIYADNAELFGDQDRVIFTGNVVFSQGENRISSDRADFNTKTNYGTFYNASGIATVKPPKQPTRPGAVASAPVSNQPTDVYFFGDTVEKVGPKKYRITNGGFSTCVQPTPRWELHAGTVILNVGHYTVLKNAILTVKGVPMLYVPIMAYPTKKDNRATGFLIPTYGSSSLRGQQLHNAFFWAIDRSQDATIEHEWYSKIGQGVAGEYRYNYGAGSNGSLTTHFIDQHEANYVQPDGSVVPTSASRSYDFRGGLNQALPLGMRAQANVSYFSNLTTNQTFNTNIYDASQNTRTVGANLVGAWGTYTLNGTFDHTEYFYGAGNATTAGTSALSGSGPKVALTRNERPLFDSPVYFSVGAEYANLLRDNKVPNPVNPIETLETNTGQTRLDFTPQIRYPFKKWQWFTVNSTFSWRDTYYSHSQIPATRETPTPQPLDESLNRRFFTAQAQIVGPVFNRIWDTPNNGYAEKFKHSIEPTLSIQRTSSIDNYNRIVQLDSTDYIVGGTTNITYGVTNRFFAKRQDAPGRPATSKEIFDVELSQSHYSNSQASQFDTSYATSFTGAAANNFSPIALTVRAVPTNALNASVRAEFDSRYHTLRTISATGSYSLTGLLQTNLSWSKSAAAQDLTRPGFFRSVDQSVNTTTTLHTRDNAYGGLYAFTYDVLHASMIQQRISGYYNSQCCGIAFEYQNYSFAGLTQILGVTADRRFFLSFTLAGLGNFSPFNGAMSGTPR